jgi:hypothetical protein
MAIIKKPQDYTPIYNDCDYIIVTGSETANNYKLVVDVTLTDLSVPFSLPIGRFKVVPVINKQTSFLNSFINLKEILIYSDFFYTYPQTIFQRRAMNVTATFGEEYSTTGAVQYYPLTSHTFFGFNGSYDTTDFRLYKYEELLDTTVLAATSGIALKQLSDVQTRDVLRSSTIVTRVLNNTTAIKRRIRFFDGPTLLSTEVTSISSFLLQDCQDFFVVEQLAPPTTTHMLVDVLRGSNDSLVSDTLRYNIEPCTGYDKCTVYFQNRYGTDDSISMSMKSQLRSETERSIYEIGYGLNNDYTRAGRSVYNSKVGLVHTLHSNWMSRVDYEALGQLVESNNVFISFESDIEENGRQASFELDFQYIAPGQFTQYQIQNGWFLNFDNGFEQMTFALGMDLFSDFADDLADLLILELLQSSFAQYYDFINQSTATTINIKFVAKDIGSKYNAINFDTTPQGNQDESYALPINLLTGQNKVYLRRPVLIEDNTFQYKKVEEEGLYRLQINVREKLDYNRQIT